VPERGWVGWVGASTRYTHMLDSMIFARPGRPNVPAIAADGRLESGCSPFAREAVNSRMITKQILIAGSSSLTEAFRDWLNENRKDVPQTITQALKDSVAEKSATEPHAASPDCPYLTTADLALRWNCCVHTVPRKVRAEELPSLMLSKRHLLISLDTVLKFESGATLV